MTGSIFTLGYAHPDAAKILAALMESNPSRILCWMLAATISSVIEKP